MLFRSSQTRGLGKEISLYIYYENGDKDGIEEHEYVAPGTIAYVNGGFSGEGDGGENYEYMICIDAQTLCEFDDNGNPDLEIDNVLSTVDTVFCHELFHAFMDDYNRTGMTGLSDSATYNAVVGDHLSNENYEKLINEMCFPNWFIEGIAGCVGNIYQADIDILNEYRYDCEKQDYTDTCTNDQLKFIYANQGYMGGTGDERYDLEAAAEDNSDGHLSADRLPAYSGICFNLYFQGKRRKAGEQGTSGIKWIYRLCSACCGRGKRTIFPYRVLGLILIAMGTYRSPAVALMPDIIPKPLRSKANAIINLMGALGGIIYLAVAALMYPNSRIAGLEHVDYGPLFITVSFIMTVSVIVMFVTVRERELTLKNQELENKHPEWNLATQDSSGEEVLPGDVKRSLAYLLASIALWFIGYNGITTWFTTYIDKVMGQGLGGASTCLLIASGGAIVSYIPIGSLSSRIGRKRTILVGVAILAGFLIRNVDYRILFPYATVFVARAAIRRGVPVAVWTIRNNDDNQNAINEGFVPIFEQFDPGVK